jgi:hypothetical protein
MIGYFKNLLTSPGKSPQRNSPLMAEPMSPMSRSAANRSDRVQTYSKVFRYRLPDGHTQDPRTVEVVGSFTHWKPLALDHDSVLNGWHLTVHHIIGNRTHHYMMLIDSQPFFDKMCDGLAVPHGPQEERFQLMTEKGPRVLMLFAQTK